MPDSDATRIAVLQEQLREMKEDLAGLVQESQRTRNRLHNLESAAQAQMTAQEIQRKQLDDRQRRIEVRTQVLSVVIGVATIIVPLITIALHFQ